MSTIGEGSVALLFAPGRAARAPTVPGIPVALTSVLLSGRGRENQTHFSELAEQLRAVSFPLA